MSFKHLVLVGILSISLLVGCGGGGGGSNPVGATASELLAADYPTIAASYVDMQTVVENNAGDPATRVNDFMDNIAPGFTNIAGAAGKFADLKAVTLSRLKRYTFNSHVITPTSHVVVDADTVKVVTYMKVNVTLKTGEIGNAPQNQDIYLENVPITWTKVGGVWKLLTGLPYTSDEYFNVAD